ncbi:MAG: D-glycero-beta-D-manno-heptose 1-phosphate adenylyltransferase [Phycisphaerae bacterium]|nr:D-glycero-beta-D-manno-heptose 1-phosphate adenylyltransferase [Phycisphaerae bacterium]
MTKDLIHKVTHLGSPKILVVGDFMLDVYIYGDATRISPEAPVPVLKIKETLYSGGGASSVAADIAALEAQPLCLGLIGNDVNADRLKARLEEANIDTSGLLTVPDRPTITKTRLIGLAQHRHQQQLFRMDEESTAPLSPALIDQLTARYRDMLDQVSVVCLQDYNKGLLTHDVCQTFIAMAAAAGKPVLVDPANIPDYTKYSGATLITPNRQEASDAVGFELDTEDDFARASQFLFDKMALSAVVITLDKQGAFLKTADIHQIIPTRPRRVYDVTGAGDMVLAMLATALAAGYEYTTAVQLSNIAGGLEVEKFGVATVSREEIITEIIGQHQEAAPKVCRLKDLIGQLAWHRSQSHTIVFTNGCFDILHKGHVDYLQFCKSSGDIVVVGMNSDESVRTIKGPERPINAQDDRAAVLAGLASVDYVTIFNEPDPLNLIKAVQPDILVKGSDWKDKGVVGREFVEAHGGCVLLAPLLEGRSSTAVINKMKS